MHAVPSDSFADFSFERPDGFRAPSLAREAIPQCSASITETTFEIICAWYSNIKFVPSGCSLYSV